MFEIGTSLHDARARQRLDLADVELATKIRAKYLRALEEEQFDVLPSDTYVKGFLRTYAEYLGLDGQLYVDEYSSRFVVDRYDEQPLRRSSARRPSRNRGIERRVVMLALVGIATLTALVIVAWKYGGSNTPSTPPAPGSHTTTQRSAPAELELRGITKGSYVEVRRGSAAGAVLLQATVPPGKIERVAGSRFWLFVRHPAGVDVFLGGKAVSLPARKNLKVIVTPTRTALAHG
jgi:cytoskeleton protein RodZ